MAWMVFVSGSENTRATRAGARASFANRSGSGDHGTMSIRSPPSSLITACMRGTQGLARAGPGQRAGTRADRHDVDPLASQLVDHGLHARALESHACAHRIDRVVAGG